MCYAHGHSCWDILTYIEYYGLQYFLDLDAFKFLVNFYWFPSTLLLMLTQAYTFMDFEGQHWLVFEE